jgi:hypothetical protein
VTPHRAAVFCFHARQAVFPYADDGNGGGEVEAVNLFFLWEAPRPLLLLPPGSSPLVCLGDSLARGCTSRIQLGPIA